MSGKQNAPAKKQKVNKTEERIFAAAWLKAEYPISYVDAFAASLAHELKAAEVTGDPEFNRLKDSLSLFWLAEK